MLIKPIFENFKCSKELSKIEFKKHQRVKNFQKE